MARFVFGLRIRRRLSGVKTYDCPSQHFHFSKNDIRTEPHPSIILIRTAALLVLNAYSLIHLSSFLHSNDPDDEMAFFACMRSFYSRALSDQLNEKSSRSSSLITYRGQGDSIPKDVKRIKISSKATRIRNRAFFRHRTLQPVTGTQG